MNKPVVLVDLEQSIVLVSSLFIEIPLILTNKKRPIHKSVDGSHLLFHYFFVASKTARLTMSPVAISLFFHLMRHDALIAPASIPELITITLVVRPAQYYLPALSKLP